MRAWQRKSKTIRASEVTLGCSICRSAQKIYRLSETTLELFCHARDSFGLPIPPLGMQITNMSLLWFCNGYARGCFVSGQVDPSQADRYSKIRYIRYIRLYSAKNPLYFWGIDWFQWINQKVYIYSVTFSVFGVFGIFCVFGCIRATFCSIPLCTLFIFS